MAKAKAEEEKKKAEELLKKQKKEALKKNNVRHILSKKRENPKNLNKGNLKGLDLEIKNSQMIFDKKAIPNDQDDEIFVQNNRLLDSLDLSNSSLFALQMQK